MTLRGNYNRSFHYRLYACLSLIFVITTGIYAQNTSKNVFEELIGTVLKEETKDTAASKVPDIISEIVLDYYAEATVPVSSTIGALSYLTNAYSEHGYNETGSWVKNKYSVKYKPYQGELPEYEFSDFQMPVAGILTSGFGYRKKFHRDHKGIDISLKIGQMVRCALPGVVVKTGYDPSGYGLYVIVAHAGGMETLYGHLSSYNVMEGQKLNSGDIIGEGGITGNSTGPHLHFETRIQGVAIDPVAWFNLGARLR